MSFDNVHGFSVRFSGKVFKKIHKASQKSVKLSKKQSDGDGDDIDLKLELVCV